jgi:hypothetical protein
MDHLLLLTVRVDPEQLDHDLAADVRHFLKRTGTSNCSCFPAHWTMIPVDEITSSQRHALAYLMTLGHMEAFQTLADLQDTQPEEQ